MEEEVQALPHGSRCFYTIPNSIQIESDDVQNDDKKSITTKEKLFKFIFDNVIGLNSTFSGPYGLRKVIYCDYIASAKPLYCIEDFIRNHVLSMYGNSHTTTSVTSLQSTLFLHESRDIIRNAVRASEHDAVIFTGNGVTGAVHKLINALNFNKPPVVFSGPFEHHSNLLPWREVSSHIVQISQDKYGHVNLLHLETALKTWHNVGLPMVGCFSAASNVTGKLSDTIKISKLLHAYGALAFWDYATAGPYIDIDMHPLTEDGIDASKDAVFLSMHKFVGGVDSPGVLIASRKLFANKIPSDAGGGSVFFVTNEDHRYLQDEEAREEGGTPAIVGSIRAGLAFKLKQDVGVDTIMEKETKIYHHVRAKWKSSKNIKILGDFETNDSMSQKLSVFSIMIHHPDSNFYLHHNYVATLLNDLYGIQARGGCACAGPYAQYLLGIDLTTAKNIEKLLLEDSRLDRIHLRRRREYSQHEILRPGFVRLNFPYFMSDEEVDFIIEAVLDISEYGWTLLPEYKFNPESGEWRHIKHQVFTDRKWLGHVKFGSEGIQFKEPDLSKIKKGPLPETLQECLQKSKEVLSKNLKKSAPSVQLPDPRALFNDAAASLRWFLTPYESQIYLKNGCKTAQQVLPFQVRSVVNELSENEILDSVKIPEKIYLMLKNFTDEKLSSNEINNHALPIKEKDDVPKVCILNPKVKDLSVPVKFVPPPKRLFKLTTKAIDDFKMIQNKDKVLVCLSGGKDSLSLLHTLHQYQYYAKNKGIKFELGAVTVDPKTKSYDPSPLIKYLAELGLPYFYESQAILDQALALPELTSICAFCSRMKRGRIYACARREKWNVLAMGQHLDDLAESFLMSAFQNGFLRTMKANYTVKNGDLSVIRPFVYVREKDTRDFAETSRFPVIPENCPACFEAPKERHRMKQLLAAQEVMHPKLFYSLKEALLPLMSKNKTGMESNSTPTINLQENFMDEDYD